MKKLILLMAVILGLGTFTYRYTGLRCQGLVQELSGMAHGYNQCRVYIYHWWLLNDLGLSDRRNMDKPIQEFEWDFGWDSN